MYLPAMKEDRKKTKKTILDFKGLNLGDNYSEGQFEDCRGISLKDYPCIVPGRAEKREGESEGIFSVYERDGLVTVEKVTENEKMFGKLCFKGDFVGEISVQKKTFCGINSKIVIMPDKVYFDREEKELYSMGCSKSFKARFEAGKIIAEGIVTMFKKGDAIHISGSKAEGNNKSAIIREIKESTLIFDDNIFTPTEEDESEEINVERKIPNFKFVCENNNRIWGVEGDTIRSSKLGDPTNFDVYDGLSTDSYSVAVASPGEWTAIIGYKNKILCFKEDVIHVIYGTKPSNYQLYTYNVPGVMKGAEKSLQIIDEVLYYKGKEGVYSYVSGVPELISRELGTGKSEGGVSGKDGSVYFIQMKKDGVDTLYSYDTKFGFWLKEKEVNITDFTFSDNKLLYISDGKLYSYTYDNNDGREWEFTLKPFTEYIDEKKIYSSVFIKCGKSEMGAVRVYVSYDSGRYDEVDLSWKKGSKNTYIPIYPQRCDSFKIKVCGQGDFKIKSISREFEIGSDDR